MRPSSLFVVFPMLALIAPAVAQGVLPLSGTYRIGELDTVFDGPCGLAAQPSFLSVDGTLVFQTNGAFTSSAHYDYVCANGSTGSGPPESGAGLYTVTNSGHLDLDWTPMSPGADHGVLFLRADGSVAIASPPVVDQNAYLAVLVALSSGHSNADLAGPYHFIRFVQRNLGPAPGAYAMESVSGTISFDGNGGYVEASGSTRCQLAFGGTGTTSTLPANAGSYAIGPDGSLTAGTASGAMSADGEFFFWLRRGPGEAELAVGVRQANNRTAQEIAGNWRIASMANNVAAQALPGDLQTDWGTMTLTPAGSSFGTTSTDSFRVDLTPSGANWTYASQTSAFTFGPNGDLHLATTLPTPHPMGGVSADGSLMIALVPPGNGIGMLIGISASAYPSAFGVPTPGSGGCAPLLQSIGGFPHAGNGAFGLLVACGRGGAPAILGLSFAAPTAGFPLLGGTIYLDVTQPIVTELLLLSGPAGVAGIGAAGMALPLPNSPLLAGLRLVGQALVLDAGAPQGFAMSAGLSVTVCR